MDNAIGSTLIFSRKVARDRSSRLLCVQTRQPPVSRNGHARQFATGNGSMFSNDTAENRNKMMETGSDDAVQNSGFASPRTFTDFR
jgi:hypothetical protein